MEQRPHVTAGRRTVGSVQATGAGAADGTSVLHLRTDDTSLVIDARGPGLPAILHWGASLGALADVDALADHLVAPPARSGLDMRVPLTMLPEASDCNDALERQTIQRWTGLFLPPELIGAHVGPPRSHTTGRTHDLSFRVATAVFGHFGIEWDIATASEDDLAALAEAIAFYKRVRGLLHSGTVVHADHPDPAAWVHGVVAADRSRALYCLAQLTSSQWSVPPPVRLPGLDDDRRYRVEVTAPAGPAHTVARSVPSWTAGDGVLLAGHMLARVGLPAPVLSPEQALLISVDAVEGDETTGAA